MRPWLIQLGPLLIPSEGREEMHALSFGLTPAEYIDKVWAQRVKEAPTVRRVRSRSWPPTCRTKAGFVLPAPETNVTPIRKAKARV